MPDGSAPACTAMLPKVDKPAFVRELGPVNVADLCRCVDQLSERAWRREDEAKENDYGCFDHTQHLVFRFIAGNRSPLRFYSKRTWRVWQRLLQPVMAKAAAGYGYVRPLYPKAMLARLAPGHGIDEHADDEDGGASHPFTHKIHVPLRTNPQATLTVAGRVFHVPAGHAFEVNNLAVHGAFNGGRQHRIHFVFEVFEGAAVAADELEAASIWFARPLANADRQRGSRTSTRPPVTAKWM